MAGASKHNSTTGKTPPSHRYNPATATQTALRRNTRDSRTVTCPRHSIPTTGLSSASLPLPSSYTRGRAGFRGQLRGSDRLGSVIRLGRARSNTINRMHRCLNKSEKSIEGGLVAYQYP